MRYISQVMGIAKDFKERKWPSCGLLL